MQTVLHISEMELGKELEVRELHENFPTGALDRDAGVERIVAFIGSGYYALEITVSDGDFQDNYHRFLDTPEVKELFSALSAYVKHLPRPGEGTADMPLTSPMLLWHKPGAEHAFAL